jgi:hypothetical protein
MAECCDDPLCHNNRVTAPADPLGALLRILDATLSDHAQYPQLRLPQMQLERIVSMRKVLAALSTPPAQEKDAK